MPTRTARSPVLLAADQEFGEGATLRVPPRTLRSVSPVEVGEHHEVEQLGAASGTEGVQTLAQWRSS